MSALIRMMRTPALFPLTPRRTETVLRKALIQHKQSLISVCTQTAQDCPLYPNLTVMLKKKKKMVLPRMDFNMRKTKKEKKKKCALRQSGISPFGLLLLSSNQSCSLLITGNASVGVMRVSLKCITLRVRVTSSLSQRGYALHHHHSLSLQRRK